MADNQQQAALTPRMKKHYEDVVRPAMIAEFGAQIVKTYYCDDFETVTASCPVPIVIAGGKKLPEPEALTMCYRAIREGAAGVDMGRNIFQADHPIAMVQAVRGIVHDNLTDVQALELYKDLRK